MNSDNIDFVTYCIGNLSRRLGLNARDVYHRLKTSGILADYIIPSYDVLHTFSKEYLMEDLTDFMKEKGVLDSWKFTMLQWWELNILILHDEGWHAILEAKFARVISEISKMYNVSLDDAMDMFYNSETMQLMEEGVADLHCRSEKYLAEEVWREKHSWLLSLQKHKGNLYDENA